MQHKRSCPGVLQLWRSPVTKVCSRLVGWCILTLNWRGGTSACCSSVTSMMMQGQWALSEPGDRLLIEEQKHMLKMTPTWGGILGIVSFLLWRKASCVYAAGPWTRASEWSLEVAGPITSPILTQFGWIWRRTSQLPGRSSALYFSIS